MSASPAQKAKILLVDDRPENLLALEAVLEPLEQELIRANDGQEALRYLLQSEFAVILMDVQMPGMNGFELARVIKSREKTRYVPIIFLTAISKEEDFVFEGYSVGAVDYMSKPFNPDVLRSKVAVFVDLHLKNRQLQDQLIRLRESERRELELEHRARITESESKVAQIVQSVTEAIIMLDPALNISMFNSGAEKMFCYKAAEVMFTPIGEMLHPTSYADFVSQLHLLVPGKRNVVRWMGGDHDETLIGRRADGTEFPMTASLSRLEVQGGVVFTIIASDVSERHAAELALRERTEELARAGSRLEALNRELNGRTRELERALAARGRFYASMSHELRTPINAIIGYSSLLLENIYGPLNEDQAAGIERSYRAANHLLELVNDILDLSKIEAGKIELQLSPVIFPSLLEDLFVTVRPMADEYGSELTLEAGEHLKIISDPRRVRQIVLNLLSNAIKFGLGNPIRLTCHGWDEGGVEIKVIDHGVGISEDDQHKIFEEFVQIGEPEQRQNGTGLGLAISKQLSETLGGALTVESRIGEGSTFTLRLPAVADASSRDGSETGRDTSAAVSDPFPLLHDVA